MNASLTIEALLARLDAVFAPLPKERRAGVHAEFARQLRAFEGTTLALAADEVLDEWTKVSRPMPAEFRKACVRLAPRQESQAEASARERAIAAAKRETKIREACRAVAQRTIENAGAEIERNAGPQRWNASPYRMTHLELDRRGIIVSCVRDHVAKVCEPIVRQAIVAGAPLPHVYAVTDEDWNAIFQRYDTAFQGDWAAPKRASGFITLAGASSGETNRRDDWKQRASFVTHAERTAPREAGGPHSPPEPPPMSEDEVEAALRLEPTNHDQADEKTGETAIGAENDGHDAEKISPAGDADDELAVI